MRYIVTLAVVLQTFVLFGLLVASSPVLDSARSTDSTVQLAPRLSAKELAFVFYNRGIACELAGNAVCAGAYFRQAYSVLPGHPLIRAKAGVAELLLRQG